MTTQWPSPGKLNLFLYITGRRLNGYHYLQTLFQLIDYGDTIEFLITGNGKIRLFNTMNNIILHDNLIIRAATLLHNYCFGSQKKILGVDIILNKVLPIGSGLGGGSSNAATTLVILNQKWKCYLTKKVLMNLGLMLGADVPLFIYGFSAFGESFGQKLTSISIPKRWYLIIMPPISIKTVYIFNKYKLFGYYSLYRPTRILLTTVFKNDFDPIVRQLFPEIKIYFKYLSQYALARLTGTGSCIFAEFYSEQLALKIQGFLPSWIKSIVVKGVQTSPLYKILSKKY